VCGASPGHQTLESRWPNSSLSWDRVPASPTGTQERYTHTVLQIFSALSSTADGCFCLWQVVGRRTWKDHGRKVEPVSISALQYCLDRLLALKHSWEMGGCA
jgi:hypothetical protein